MEDNRNNNAVERKLKESLKADRARIQVGRISHFGLLELSRQRLRPSLIETNFRVCAHCAGTGMVRSTESASVYALRLLEEEGVRRRSSEVTITTHPDVALYLLNYKREMLASVETRYGMKVFVLGDPTLIPPNARIDRLKAARLGEDGEPLPPYREPERDALPAPTPVAEEDDVAEEEEPREHRPEGRPEGQRDGHRDRNRDGHRDRDRNRDRGRNRDPNRDQNRDANRDPNRDPNREPRVHEGAPRDEAEGGGRKRRRRRRRGGGGPEGRDRNDGQPVQQDENRSPQVQAEHAGGEFGAPANDMSNGAPNSDAQGFAPGEGDQGDAGARDESRRRRRGRRGGRRRRRGGEGNEQGQELGGEHGGNHGGNGGDTLAAASQGNDGGVAAALASYDAPRVSAPVESAPQSDDTNADSSSGGASRFFRAIKSRLRGDGDDSGAKDETPPPAPVAAPAPVATPAPPAPEEPSGPKRGGWWNKG